MNLSNNHSFSQEEWKAFLQAQPHEFPHHFAMPMSESGRQYFKSLLEIIAERAIKLGLTAGLYHFLMAVQDHRARDLMRVWLTTYSPIRVFKEGKRLGLRVFPEFNRLGLLADGKSNPFYSIPDANIEVDGSKERAAQQRQDLGVFNVGYQPGSELEYHKKRVKLFVNQFFSDRTVENREKLIEAINGIPIGVVRRGGEVFLQGGAAGLKR